MNFRFLPALLVFLAVVMLGCGGSSSSAAPTATAPAAGAPAGGGALTADELYGACRARVEGASTPGECNADSGCARAGCSQEVCVPVSAVAEIQTTCERLPCFQTLDTCGCHQGTCTWTLKDPAIPLKPLPVLDPAGTAPATAPPADARPGDAPQ